MKPKHPYISNTLVLAFLLMLFLESCKSEPSAPATRSEMSVSFRVETRGGSGGASEGGSNEYEDATDWENYIDIKHGDYRIGFFDKDNRCITQFFPTEIKPVENRNYIDYTLTGEVPGVLTFYSDFKIVVLANWGTYPEMKAGITSIDSLCCPNNVTLGRFEAFTGPFTGDGFKIKDGNRYVPMYGVKDYTGVKFSVDKDDNTTVLYDDLTNNGVVNMLRAIAKVEVMFDTEDNYTLDSKKKIQITNYNAEGMCAPEGCYSEGDYYHNTWATNYWKGNLHLVGGKNDSGEKTLDMTETTNKDGKTVWVAYLPEYQNIALAAGNNDYQNATVNASDPIPARITVPLKRDGKEHIATIEFATYTDGEPGEKMNIERNNLYRFTIEHVDQGIKWKVEALPWNGLVHEEIVM